METSSSSIGSVSSDWSAYSEEHVFCAEGRCYDVFRLFELSEDCPPLRIPLKDYESLINQMRWDGSPFEEAMEEPHYSRLLEVDCRYPVLIYWEDGSMRLADGTHRLMKGWLEDRPVQAARDITEVLELARIPDGEERAA